MKLFLSMVLILVSMPLVFGAGMFNKNSYIIKPTYNAIDNRILPADNIRITPESTSINKQTIKNNHMYSYNTKGELTERYLQNSDGRIYSYDKNGTQTGSFQTLPNGRVNIYDGSGKLTGFFQQFPNGKTIQYDVNGNVVKTFRKH